MKHHRPLHPHLIWFLLFLVLLSFPLFGEALQLEYYGEIGCSHCDLFREKILPAAEAEAQSRMAPGAGELQVEAEYFDILSEAGFERCEKRLAEMGLEFSVFPVLIIGNNAYQGNSAVETGLAEELTWFAERGEYLPEEQAGRDGLASREVLKEIPGSGTGTGAGTGSVRGIAFWPVFLAGLIDGVNPCAFATMLFFLSWIGLKGGSRRRMLIAASGFIVGIFAAYLAIGFGLFSFLRIAGTMGIIRALVRYLFAGLAFLFALLSLRDAWLIRKSGRAASMLLKLPRSLKRRIHTVIRKGGLGDDKAEGRGSGTVPEEPDDEEAGGDPDKGDPDKKAGRKPLSHNSSPDSALAALLLFLSLFVSGLIVSVLELACTGQIYFPTIAYMVQTGKGASPLLWLLLYNGAFILPLLGVCILAMAGISRQSIGGWFERHMATGKIATALIFFILGVMILLF